jgi:hypothetical protein
MLVALMEDIDSNFEGGNHLLDPVGGRAYGTPKNWRTSGADGSTKPSRTPLLVSTQRPVEGGLNGEQMERVGRMIDRKK